MNKERNKDMSRRLCGTFTFGILILGLALIVGSAGSVSAAEKSLYDRLGGKGAIDAVVNKFTTDQLADPRLAKFYTKTDIPAWRGDLADLICQASGGPCKYKGLKMSQAHARKYITSDQFGWTAGHLVNALNHFKVTAKERDELVAIVASLKEQVVGQ